MVKNLLILIICFLFFNDTIAQGTSGKDFWVAFMDADFYCESRTPPPKIKPGAWDEDTLELYITSKYAATVIVTVNPLSKTDFTDTFKLDPNVIHYIKLPSNIACRDFFSDYVMEFGIHITSDSNINVQAVNRFWSSKGSTTVLPSESIPNAPEYFITTNASPNKWNCWVPSGRKYAKSAEFAIVGIADYSVIEVIPTGVSSIYDNKRGIPFEIKLGKGQTYNYNTTDDDLTGTILRSRDSASKFAVFAGNRLTYSNTSDSFKVPCVSGSPYSVYNFIIGEELADMDHTYEQMLPTVTLGNSYTALPFKNNMEGYFLKIVAIENGTNVSVDGKFNRLMMQGEYFVLNVGRDSARRILADKRISVTQFAKGTKCNKHPLPKTTMGDVSQIQLIPDMQMANEANISRVTHTYSTWANTGTNFKPENYLNVMVKQADTSQFKLNGKSVPVNLWKMSYVMPGYRYAQIDLDTINYRLYSAKGFLAYVYGYAAFEGYAYAAAASFKPLHMDFVFNSQCVGDTIKFTAIKNDSFLNYYWRFGDKTGILSGNTISRIYKDTGWNVVTMYGKNVRTNSTDSVIKKIYIARADRTPVLSNDTMICGKVDFTIYSKKFDPTKYYLWNDGLKSYYYNFKIGGLFWEMVTERNGCKYIDTIRIENHPYPKAKFTTSDTVFCANGIKAMTFNNLSNSQDPILFQNWDFGDLNVNDTHKIVKHIYKKPDLYQVTLRIRTIYGCDDLASQIVEILPAPLVNFNIVNADTCFNSQGVSFKNNTIKDTINHLKFKWDFGEGTIINNRNPLSPRVYPDTGKYTTALMYEFKNGCKDTMMIPVTIYANPKAVFTFSRTGPCKNDTVYFKSASKSDHNPLKYLWLFGDNLSDSLKNVAHAYKKSGDYNINLIVETPQGCKDTVNNSIKVLGSPIADFKINDSTQCYSGNHFVFSDNSTTDTGTIAFKQWRFDDGTKIINKDTVSRSFITIGQHSLLLKVSSSLGCIDSIKKIIVTKKPLDAGFSTNKNSQCFKSQNFDFTYLPKSGNDSIKNMIWYYASDSLKNTNYLKNIKFPSDGQYTVRLKLYAQDGCDGESIQTINVNPNPVVKFSVSDTLQCLQGNVFYFINQTSITKGQLKSFSWDFGDFTTSNLKTPAPKTYLNSGQYKITSTSVSDSGCTDTASLRIVLQPAAVITVNTVSPICLNDTATLNGSATIQGGLIKNYQWDFGDSEGSGVLLSADTRHSFKRPGTYNITLTTTSDYNCKDSKTMNNWVTVNALPNAAFGYEMKDGGQYNSIVTFRNLTQPTAKSVLWDFGKYGKSKLSDTLLNINDTTTIHARLYVTDNLGCTGMIEKIIFTSPGGELFFPTAFTANGDGLNDGYGPLGIPYATNYKFTIYNRWGEMMFSSQTLGETWDGKYMDKLCQNGVYIYKLELNDFFGKYKSYEGSFLLLW